MDNENDYWSDDTKRLNDLCTRSQNMGIQINLNEGEPPALNDDGSLAEEDEEEPPLITNVDDGANCGTGAGGFKPGNTCGKGGGGEGKISQNDLLPHSDWKSIKKPGVYHATNLENLYDIANSSLRPHKPWYGTDQSAWPDGSTKSRIYFTSAASTAYSFAPTEGTPVILRIRGKLPIKTESTGDLYIEGKKLDKKRIQVATKNGWKNLSEIIK